MAASAAAAHTGLPEDLDELAATDAPDVSALGARAEGPSSPARVEAPLPARLAAPVWLRALEKAPGTRLVRVALEDGGSLELRTAPEADGVAVRIRFSDPELQQLASAHAARLRETLADHFAESVRLDLGDAAADGGSGDAPSDRPRGPSHRGPDSLGAPSSDPAPAPVRSAQAAGRREWIG